MLSVLLQTALVDANNLPIGPGGSVEVRINRVAETATGDFVTLDRIVQAARGKRFVYVGETHDNEGAHRWQSNIIGALDSAGRNVIVGLEMYQRAKQPFLNIWSMGRFSEVDFLKESDWKGQWGFDFALYRPIFDYVRKHHLRLVGLNIPRDWVRTVGKSGANALPEDAKSQLPELYLGNEEHKQVFNALIGGHPMSGNNMYAAQVLWDEAMADTAIKYLQTTSVTDNTVFVVLAGNGHLMYKQGINYRIARRTGMDGVTVITVDTKEPVKVSKGLGDFVIGTREKDSK